LCDLAEFTFTAFRGVKRDDVVTNFDICDTLTDGLDNSTSFVSADYGEGTFRIFARESVCIRVADLIRSARRLSLQCFMKDLGHP